nr:putative regulatory protein (AfsR-like protein) [Kibdelosporangium sp. MJ126-NF4]CTQ97876.1 putative regulatory protein (AfsR-like protein) [Kibdelosporangium sp. MJ126-NF4]
MLGPLDVTVDWEPVQVGKNRQLTVLAVLLMEVNKTVTVGRLVEAVWSGCAPKTAAEQIQTCVWRLRRAFAAAGAGSGLIETTPSGYSLRLAADKIDTGVFETWVREARAIADAGDHVEAIAVYRRALRLVRGPVLAEVDSLIVRSAAAKWDERVLSVLEDCVELELASGMDSQLVDELTALVERNPLRERLRWQLMLALHRSDRRADALAVYREGRAVMVGELGVEPGRKLRELHHRILNGELPHQPTATVNTAAVRVPAQLLADAPDFVERPEHAAEIRRVLTAADATGVRIVALLGRCGSGKSTLALHVAHQVREKFPDGQLYAELGTAGVGDIACGFLRALGVSDARIPADPHERAAMYRSLLATRRVLVVLDDVVDAHQVRPLLPGGPGSAVLMTSRTTVTDLAGAYPVEVGALTEPEGVEMFTGIVGAHRVAAEPEAMREILRLAGHLPLPVRAAAARLAARPYLRLGQLASRLRDRRRRLDEFSHGTLDVRASLRAGLDGLPDSAKRLWCALSMLPGDGFDVYMAAEATVGSARTAERLLDLLVDRRLVDIVGVDERGNVRYRLHDLITLYAKELYSAELNRVRTSHPVREGRAA